MSNGIVPRPRVFTPQDGLFVPHDDMKVFASDAAVHAARTLADELGLPLVGTGTGPLVVAIGTEASEVRHHPPAQAEGFALEVGTSAVVVVARDVPGLRHGLSALRQLRQETGFACATVSDYPGLGLRGIHLDLKGAMPTAAFLERVVRELGNYRVNAILMEYADKFPYRNHPELVSDDALTGDELDRILEVADECGIQVIPLVQCLGHVEYVLRKDGYERFAEGDQRDMYCPLGEGRALFEELSREVMDRHRRSTYFHVGGDEARHLGHCDACRAAVEAHGMRDLLAGYLEQVVDFVHASGFRTLMWDDMLYKLDAFDRIAGLADRVALNLWEYDTTSPRNAGIRWGERVYASKAWVDRDPGEIADYGAWLEDLPEDDRLRLHALRKPGEDLRGDAFPWATRYRELGFEVVGAACIKGGGPDWLSYDSVLPEHTERLRNVSVFARVAAERGMSGVIATAWSRFNDTEPSTEALEASLFGFACAGTVLWNPDQQPDDVSNDVAARFFMGCESERVPRALGFLEQGRKTRKAAFLHAAVDQLALCRPAHNADVLEVLQAAADFLRLKRGIEHQLFLWEPLAAYLHEKDPWRCALFRRTASECRAMLDRLEACERRLVALHERTMSYAGAEEYVRTKTIPLESRLLGVLRFAGAGGGKPS